MSKLLNTYNNLKKQSPETLFLFHSGIFYIALDDDAKFLSKELDLKLVNLNQSIVKCGFPASSLDKYILMLKGLSIDFKIVDKDTVSSAFVYTENENVKKLLTSIKNIDINNLSVSEAFAFVEKIQKKCVEILGDF